MERFSATNKLTSHRAQYIIWIIYFFVSFKRKWMLYIYIYICITQSLTYITLLAIMKILLMIIIFGHNKLPRFPISLFIFDRSTNLVLMTTKNILNIPKGTQKTIKYYHINWLQYESNLQDLRTCWFIKINKSSLVCMVVDSTKTLRS